MTTTKASGKKATYIRHSQEYKGEALKLAADLGIAKAAKQLGLHESQLYAWRKGSEHAKTVNDREVTAPLPLGGRGSQSRNFI